MKRNLNQFRDNLKDCKNGDYELVWRENKSNTDYKFPYDRIQKWRL
jgi:hypothetical protein